MAIRGGSDVIFSHAEVSFYNTSLLQHQMDTFSMCRINFGNASDGVCKQVVSHTVLTLPDSVFCKEGETCIGSSAL